MNNVTHILQRAAYWASLILIGSIPGLFIAFSDKTLGSINRLIGGLVVLLWVLAAISSGRFRRLRLFHFLAITFALWSTISVWWSVVPDDTPFPLNVPQGAALTFLLWDIYRTKARVEAGMQAFLLGGYISIVTTTYNFLHGDQARHWEKRFAGSGFDPNDIALLLAIGIPIAAYLAAERTRPLFLRLLNFLYPVGAGLVIILSGSRGALVAAVPAYLFYLATVARMGRGWRIAVCTVMLGAVIGATQMNLSEPLQRLGTVTNSASEDHLSGRADLWRAGWVVYGEHPLLGIGGGAFGEATKPLTGFGQALIAHNTYLSVLTELGPFGFLMFLGMLVTVVGGALRQPLPMRQASLLALLVWAIGVFALSWEFRSQTWFLFALIVCAGHCTESEGARDSQTLGPEPISASWPQAVAIGGRR